MSQYSLILSMSIEGMFLIALGCFARVVYQKWADRMEDMVEIGGIVRSSLGRGRIAPKLGIWVLSLLWRWDKGQSNGNGG